MLTLKQFLIVCPLVFLGGFTDSIAGGGGLISLPAYLLAGLPVHNSIATNKLSSFMGTSLATYRYHKAGYINWKRAIFCVIAAFLGSALGANLALIIEDRIFRIILLIVLPLTAAYVIFGKRLDTEREEYPKIKTAVLSSLISFVIGIYDGFYGPGTGTFLILLLTAFAHLKLTEANGTSKAVNLATNCSALAVYLINGKVLFVLGLVAGLFGIAGNYLGTRMFNKNGAKVVKPVMLAVLAIFFIKLLTELVS